MKTQFTIATARELPDGSVMVSGSVEGPFLSTVGQHGYASIAGGNVEVVIAGIGVVDPNFLTKERQGILIKMVEGTANLLVGITLEFDTDTKAEVPNVGE